MNPLSRTASCIPWTLAALIVAAPLAEGGARSWALTTIEVAAFAALALSLGALASGASGARAAAPTRPLLTPVVLFGALVALQLAPLPPAVLKTVSPAAWRLYAMSLPGWPQGRAPGPAAAAPPAGAARWQLLPTADDLARGAPLPFAHPGRGARAAAPAAAGGAGRAGGWRTLSLAPAMTAGALLELAAYAALLLALLVMPAGRLRTAGGRRLCRVLSAGVLLSGLGVATIGIVEFFTWNGRILWIFVPYDWGAPQPGAVLRASGPFVNPDHFGNYLAMALPVAVATALFAAGPLGRSRAWRVLGAVGAFLMTGALLLSLSRGGWTAGALGLGVLLALAAPAARPLADFAGGRRLRALRPARSRTARRACAAGLALLALVLLFIGPAGRRLVDARLLQTVYSDSGLGGRVELGAATLAMARDYPLAGVGLGAWPEAFPRYRRPPWIDATVREAHDDYAQLLAETGVLGFALAAWFVAAAAGLLVRAWRAAPPARALLAPLCAGLAATAFHEWFDFSLHTPANALLFVVMLGAALRIAADHQRRAAAAEDAAPPRARRAAMAGALGAAALALLAFAQDNTPYPENIRPPATLAQARALIAAHPAESAAHLALVRVAGARLAPQARMDELRAAAWLDPANPGPRDALAGVQLEQGETAQALANLTRSVAASPSLATHPYLSGRLIAWLSGAQRRAVGQGFAEAIGRHYAGAVEGLAGFDDALGRFAAEAEVYRRAAEAVRDPDLRARYLLGAGVARARAGDSEAARQLLDRVIRLAPADTRAYECLVTMVLGPRRQLAAAEAAVAEGVRAGADGAALYAALAQAAEGADDRPLAQRALTAAVACRPSYAALFRLGAFYLDEGRYERAALVMRRAAAREPGSAEAYFYLGLAEERDYRFAAAERDLARAVRLAPQNAGYRAHYAGFERKLSDSMRLGVNDLTPPGE